MNNPTLPSVAQRVLLLLGTSRDAKLTCELLERVRINCLACHSTEDLRYQLALGAGAVLIAEECLHLGGTQEMLQRVVDQQPSWSDLPILILARSGADSVAVADAVLFLGNVTLLERPLRVAALISIVQTALRARYRQYQIQEQLRSLESARDAEATAAQRKDEFLAMLSHELRNPLAPIRTALHVLALDDRDAVRRKTLREMMMRQVDHMVRLVDDLLDSSRMSRGKIELQREVIDLRAAVDRAVEASRPMIDGRYELRLQMPTEPVLVDGDLVRLTQIFSNLLNNAAKYGRPDGRVELTMEEDGREVVVILRDDGIGIENDLLPRVFDLFAQGKRDAKLAQEGLGIGLSLVRSLVLMHEGTVAVHSDGPGRGAEFTVRLPLAAGKSLAAAPHKSDLKNPTNDHAERLRVLLVDDNCDAARSLSLVLDSLGIENRTAQDGASGLILADAFRPSAAILDVGMPGMDGCEVARRLRANPVHGRTVLIALTGWGHSDDIDRCRAAGFDHHIHKPADIPALVELLNGVHASMGEIARPTLAR